MKIDIYPDEETVAREAACFIAAAAQDAVTARGVFTLAVSGGRTPWKMLRHLAKVDVPWRAVHLFQVDERVAPPGDPDRNLTHLNESLLTALGNDGPHFHPMPVENADRAAAAVQYAGELGAVAGTPPVLDLIHLGLGPDGHTASLVPGDPVLDVVDAEVSVTGVYQGRRRMTLTYPVLNRARQIVWLVSGAEKAEMLRRLREGDTAIPAGRVEAARAVVLADRAAAGPTPSQSR